METIEDDEPSASDSTFPRRVGAYLLDVAICATFVAASQFLIRKFVFGDAEPSFAQDGIAVESFVLATVSLPVWLYFIAFEASSRRATPGKQAFGLEVSSLEEDPLTLSRIIVRNLVKLLPWELTHVALLVPTPLWTDPNAALMRPLFMLSTFLVGSWLVTAMIHPKHQGVHDLLVRTIVQRRGALPITNS